MTGDDDSTIDIVVVIIVIIIIIIRWDAHWHQLTAMQSYVLCLIITCSVSL